MSGLRPEVKPFVIIVVTICTVITFIITLLGSRFDDREHGLLTKNYNHVHGWLTKRVAASRKQAVRTLEPRLMPH